MKWGRSISGAFPDEEARGREDGGGNRSQQLPGARPQAAPAGPGTRFWRIRDNPYRCQQDNFIHNDKKLGTNFLETFHFLMGNLVQEKVQSCFKQFSRDCSDSCLGFSLSLPHCFSLPTTFFLSLPSLGSMVSWNPFLPASTVKTLPQTNQDSSSCHRTYTA